MKSDQLIVRCMAWPEGGLWVAVSIDFGLAAQGETRDQAQDALHEQIRSYVHDALTVDAAHIDDLLSRRAPLRDRLRFAFWDALARRPRVRRRLGSLVRRIGIALTPKQAYSDPLPVIVGA